jgi:hypothetical protein
MSAAKDDPAEANGEKTKGLVKAVTRYALTFAIIVLLQLGVEKLIFGQIGPDPAFEKDLVGALQALDPFELGKLWGESIGFYSEPISDTPEYAACMERPSALDYVCIGEAEKKRLTVRVSADDYFNWFPASLIKSVWNVLIYQFQDTQTPAYRLVAFCQIIVGFGLMTAIMAGLLRRESLKNVHPFLLLTLYLVGCVACSSLLAWPLRLLALALTAKITTGIYAATTVQTLNKAVDTLMHRNLDRVIDATWR